MTVIIYIEIYYVLIYLLLSYLRNFPMEKTIVVVALLAIMAIMGSVISQGRTNPDALEAYQKWKEDFGMKFSPEEDLYRMKIFIANLEVINKHNAKSDRAYSKAVNKFTGITD